MGQNNIDQFFRERLDSIHVTPKEDSWNEIKESVSASTRNRWRTSMAAAAIFIALSCMFVLSPIDKLKSSSAQVTKSSMEDKTVPEKTVALVPDKEFFAASVPSTTRKAHKITPKMAPEPAAHLNFETLSLEAKTNAILVTQSEPAITSNPFDLINTPSKISIIYLANATPDTSQASKRKIDKLWNYARNSAPADIMADIRDAKDQFFDSKISLD